jgi:V/A-type H+-transporting ATPase subunit I
MIVPMKKVTLVCLETERESALTHLRDLGVMHLQPENSGSTPELQSLTEIWCSIQKAVNVLSNVKPVPGFKAPVVTLTGRDIHQETLALIDEQQQLGKEVAALQNDLSVVEPWGQFSMSSLRQLESGGVHVYPCFGPVGTMRDIKQQYHCACEIISSDKHNARFVLISDSPIDHAAIPLVVFPEQTDLGNLRVAIEKCRTRLEEIATRFQCLAANKQILDEYFAETAERVEFYTNRDSMSNQDKLSYIDGYIPARDEQKLKDAATSYGWGLLLTKPGPTDQVPTLIELPKFFKMVQPLFKFLGLTTGYNEVEVSICFLIFFSIFFGIIFSDAGYGVIFLAIGLFAKYKFREERFRLPINLFLLLSTVTVIWGAMCGSWCGIEHGGFEWLSEPENPELKNKHTELVCFVLAAIHLSTGHLMQVFKHFTVKRLLGHLGWICVLCGNFILATILIIYPGSFPLTMFILYGVGFLLILTCFIHWHDPAEVFSFPLETLSSFVDTLSYIRLFAVSVAGYYIAVNFNEMGVNLIKTSPWFILLAIPTIVIGHLLNIILAFLGVLVHGVRLNTLEFSNHAHLKWGGFQFKPFKKESPEQKTIT